jgi:iron(III) transport system permease protein
VFNLDAPFFLALARSLAQATLAGGVSLALGWPAGVAAGVWNFPGRRALILTTALPLLLPSFLVAIGLSLLWRGFGGLGASIWAFAWSGMPLVFFATLSATHTVTRGQADAARLAGGEGLLFRLTLRGTQPVAALAAVLAAVLTLADVGPGQIFGWHSAASEMLISFAARYDLALATHQAMTLAIVAAICAWPAVWRLAPLLTTSLLSRDTAKIVRSSRPMASFAFAALVLGLVVFPLAGLLRPLLGHTWPLARAWSEVARTWADTALYAALAAGFAVAAGFAGAALARRSAQRHRLAVAAALALFALPPVLPALWLMPLSSRFTVGAALALRCLPVALLFGLRAFGAMPRSWSDAAAVHRVPHAIFALRVVAPWLARWAAPAALLAALLATAEIGVVLLLHPPGHGTLPLAIFTVMANAPEALVAALCLLYVGLVVVLGCIVTLSRPPA